jgi:hypothetical protein
VANLVRLLFELKPQNLPKVQQKHVANVWFQAKLEHNHIPLSIGEHTISILYTLAGTCIFHTHSITITDITMMQLHNQFVFYL